MLGQLATVSLEKKFGNVKSTPARQVRTMAMIFQRSKCSICRPISFGGFAEGRAQAALSRCLFRRFALAAHIDQRRLQDADAQGSDNSTSTSSEVSEAFVTLPTNPPEVMTVSPRRT